MGRNKSFRIGLIIFCSNVSTMLANIRVVQFLKLTVGKAQDSKKIVSAVAIIALRNFILIE